MNVVNRLTPYSGLKVLISGGAAGIGEVLAAAYLEIGAKVHVCDVSERAVSAFRERYPEALATLADVSNSDEVKRVFEIQREWVNGLDVLINNAGIAGPTGGIEKITDVEWEQTIDINLNAQYRFAHHAIPLLVESEHAHIIHISSVAGRLGYAWRTPYAATKWAIVGLMKSLAAELGEKDIRVNALLPGIVEGPRQDRVISDRARQLGISEPEMLQQTLKKISLRRMTPPEDVAAMALFLCSPAAHNVTGQAISIDGNVEYL
jgi:NAD(P)-dependent dehydrogenase (short-subunit alcohol dehydrogenase family)